MKNQAAVYQTSRKIDYVKDRDEYDKGLASKLSKMSIEDIYAFRDGKLVLELEDSPRATDSGVAKSKKEETWEKDVLRFIQGGPELDPKRDPNPSNSPTNSSSSNTRGGGAKADSGSDAGLRSPFLFFDDNVKKSPLKLKVNDPCW